MDNEGCAQGMVDFIKDNKLQQRIIDYLHAHDYGNEDEVKKVTLLLE